MGTKPDNARVKEAEHKKAEQMQAEWQKEYDNAGLIKKAKMKLKKWAKSIWGWIKKAGAWIWKHTVGPVIAKAKKLMARALNFLTNIITYVMLRSLGGMSHSETMAVTFGKDIEKKQGENKEAGAAIDGVHEQMLKVGEDASEGEKQAVNEANRQAVNIVQGRDLQAQIQAEDKNLASLESVKRGQLDSWKAANRPYFEQQASDGEDQGVDRAEGRTGADVVASPAAEPTVQPQAAADLVIAAREVTRQSHQAEAEVKEAAEGAFQKIESEEDGLAQENVKAVQEEAEAEKAEHQVEELPEDERKVVEARIEQVRRNSAMRRGTARKVLLEVRRKHARQQVTHRAKMSNLGGGARQLAGKPLGAVRAALERIEKGIQEGASMVDADREGAYDAIRKGLGGTYGGTAG
ncbi:MAG: hypothetical protein GXP54_06695 [Deltaproteobacteria bacterium]|nr:hypothetical protein [Deltaproteobacteria bacterium]